MYCVDTSVIIDVLRGDKILGAKIDDFISTGLNVFVTPITLSELYRGAYGHVNSDKKIYEVKSFVSSFDFLDFDEKSCEEFGKMYFKLKKSGKIISDFDLMIAAIVKSKNLILITRDKDFDKTGIKVKVF